MKGRAIEYANQLPSDWKQFAEYFVSMADRMGSRPLSSPGLAIKAGGGVLVKAGSAFHALLSDGKVGRLISKAANTDMAALSGTVTNAKHNVFVFFMDNAGNLTSAMGVEGASLSAVTLPPVPPRKVVLGYVHINPTGTGNFVGNTTPLDDATVVPNAVYINNTGVFDPTIIP